MADEDVELFGLEGVGELLLRLPVGQVRQQVRDGEDRIGRVLADGHRHHRAVLFRHHAVQGERAREPLVLADAAVIVGLELRHAAVLVERALLEVDARGVAVRSDQAEALAQGLFALARDEDGLAPKHAKDGVAVKRAVLAFLKSCPGQGLAHELHGFAFGLAGRKEVDIAAGQLAHGGPVLGRGVGLEAGLGLDGESGLRLGCVVRLGHDASLPPWGNRKPS